MNADHHEVIVRSSPYDFTNTVARLTNAIVAQGARVFAVIDHAAGASDAGLALPSISVVIFGNPAVGTLLMIDTPDVELGLPSRVLVREAAGGVHVALTG